MFAKIALMFSAEGWDWRAVHSLVWCREYHGTGGPRTAGFCPDPEGCTSWGTAGGAMGGFRWVCIFGVDWPGLGGLGGGWIGMNHCQTLKLAGHS